ncbi:MAG: UDP-N-acetylmuramoyl-L-alanine--D-glutamate ligase [Opitutaceae bacterium]|nr:UDP-N-acetylmuramoyl-L-alanine--D-glutamate ligase [Opitutaceae bacterium]
MLSAPAFLQPRLRRPVAVLGAGVSGGGVLALLRALGVGGVTYDERGTAFTPAAASGHDLAVYSPGFAPGHAWLRLARENGLLCLGELDFASLCWRGRVVAVTGTNGKTTLTEFLTHALQAAGEPAFATGNIGRPFTGLVAERSGGAPRDIAVCEVSSFQAETLEHLRPESVLWTNFAEDHLERHAGMADYFAAKWNLVARAGSHALVAGPTVLRQARELGRPWPADALVTSADAPFEGLAGTVFAEPPQTENYRLAAAWWRREGRDEAVLQAAARTFRLGRHRLARVAEIGGVTYWNDSKATNFHAVEAALARFPRPVLLIAGGKAKGGDIAGFVRRIAPRVRHLCLIGETQAALAAACAACRVAHTLCAGLLEAVQTAARLAVAGDAVLLSPGFASFDQFRNYEDRGDQFEKLVGGLGTVASLR